MKNAIDLALLKQPSHSLQSLIATLEKEGIYTVRRETTAGMVYGLTFLDHKTRCVFNGSDLGKPYSAKGLQERCLQDESVEPQINLIAPAKVQQAQRNFDQPEYFRSQRLVKEKVVIDKQPPIADPSYSPDSKNVLEHLLQPEPTAHYIPSRLIKNNRKKKRKTI